MSALPFRVMLISDENADLVARIDRALSRPLPVKVAVQLRMKNTPPRLQRTIAEHLRVITRERGALLLINDRLDVALDVHADGVQLPRDGLTVPCARALLPEGALVGVSCHSQSEVQMAADAGASYALLSPIHPVEGKAPAMGIDGFGQVAAQNALPLVALGGIGEADVSGLKTAGAAGIAVLRGVMAAGDPREALGRICAAVRSA